MDIRKPIIIPVAEERINHLETLKKMTVCSVICFFTNSSLRGRGFLIIAHKGKLADAKTKFSEIKTKGKDKGGFFSPKKEKKRLGDEIDFCYVVVKTKFGRGTSECQTDHLLHM